MQAPLTFAPAETHVINGTDQSFPVDVIEMSKTVPVIVDFWATWCGPCKTLGPALEAAVARHKGKVKMVKIDVDKNPAFAGQLRVQSIPTVYGFFNGQPVDAFQGAIPNSQVEQFVAKLAALAGDDGLGEALIAAEQMLAEGAATEAAETFAAILQEEPGNAAAYGGLVRCYIALKELDQAEAILNGAPAAIATKPEVEAARAHLGLARQAANAGPVDLLRARLTADAADHQARFDLAIALHAAGKVEEAVNELLDLFRRDRDWNDGAAKTQLFTIFDALTAKDPIVLNGRRKLSSLIFA